MKCQFIKENKDNCRANAISTDKFCFSHSPQTEQAKLEAVRNGGKSSKTRLEKVVPPIGNHNPKSILYLLHDTIDRLRQGQMTPHKGSAIAKLASLSFEIIAESKLSKEHVTLADIILDKVTDEKAIEEYFKDEMSSQDWRDKYSVEERHKGKDYNLFTAHPVQ